VSLSPEPPGGATTRLAARVNHYPPCRSLRRTCNTRVAAVEQRMLVEEGAKVGAGLVSGRNCVSQTTSRILSTKALNGMPHIWANRCNSA
jgi:hypothetical protein